MGELGFVISLTVGMLQLYGLVFLLGSFSVATISDLRRMSAQVEFVEIWSLAVAVFFLMDIYGILVLGIDILNGMLVHKWTMVLIFLFISNWRFGILFRMAKGDLIACVSVLMILPFIVGLMFLVLLKTADFVMRPLLRKFGDGKAYPFIPVVFTATVCVFLVEVFLFAGRTLTVSSIF